jgi:hypothetical protein
MELLYGIGKKGKEERQSISDIKSKIYEGRGYNDVY